MEIEKIIKELKAELEKLFTEKFSDFPKEVKTDLEEFIEKSEEKIKRWTLLLRDNAITPEEFAWLIKSQKDLLELRALYSVGISKIKLGHFKNKVLDTILETILRIILK